MSYIWLATPLAEGGVISSFKLFLPVFSTLRGRGGLSPCVRIRTLRGFLAGESQSVRAPNAELRISLQQTRIQTSESTFKSFLTTTSTVPYAFHGWGHDPDQVIIAPDCKLNIIIDVYFLMTRHTKLTGRCYHGFLSEFWKTVFHEGLLRTVILIVSITVLWNRTVMLYCGSASSPGSRII